MDLENSENHDILVSQSPSFTDEYKDACFYVWYNAGKPTVKDLYDRIPFPITNFGRKPTQTTLHTWIYNYFTPRAVELDEGVRETINTSLIATKVEMLERQAEIGKKMQNLGLEYLEEHKDEITANAAVRLVVEGLRIEFERSGIPDMLKKMSEMSDEQLLEEVIKEFEDADIELDDENE